MPPTAPAAAAAGGSPSYGRPAPATTCCGRPSPAAAGGGMPAAAAAAAATPAVPSSTEPPAVDAVGAGGTKAGMPGSGRDVPARAAGARPGAVVGSSGNCRAARQRNNKQTTMQQNTNQQMRALVGRRPTSNTTTPAASPAANCQQHQSAVAGLRQPRDVPVVSRDALQHGWLCRGPVQR
jgi:hypothetical protein